VPGLVPISFGYDREPLAMPRLGEPNAWPTAEPRPQGGHGPRRPICSASLSLEGGSLHEAFLDRGKPRKVAAGREAKTPLAVTPCDFTDCACQGPTSAMRKADRNPELRRPQDLSPLSED